MNRSSTPRLSRSSMIGIFVALITIGVVYQLYYHSETDLSIEVKNESGVLITDVMARVGESVVEFGEVRDANSAVVTGLSGLPAGMASLQWTENGNSHSASAQITDMPRPQNNRVVASDGPPMVRLVLSVIDANTIQAALE